MKANLTVESLRSWEWLGKEGEIKRKPQTHKGKKRKPNVWYLLNISLHKFIMSGRFLSKHRDEKSTPWRKKRNTYRKKNTSAMEQVMHKNFLIEVMQWYQPNSSQHKTTLIQAVLLKSWNMTDLHTKQTCQLLFFNSKHQFRNGLYFSTKYR